MSDSCGMDGVPAPLAARARFLSHRQREFVHAVAQMTLTLGLPQLIRSQITLNAIHLCEGAISQVLFLQLTDNRKQFKDLLEEHQDLFGGKRDWPSPKRVQRAEFALRMAQCKLRKRCAVDKKDVIADIPQEEQIEEAAPSRECEQIPQWWNILREHYFNGERNFQSFEKTGSTNGFRYPNRELRHMYVLASLSGKMSYNVFHELLGFPCWTTVKGYRREMKAEIGLTFENFNGKKVNLAAVLACFPFTGVDKRCVLSIDATAVKCNFGVKADGTVLGTVEPQSLSPERALAMSQDQCEFERFHAENVHQIAKAVFVVMVNPLSSDDREFPIAVFPYHQGQMDDIILNKLLAVNNKMRKLGVEVVGNGFDGDGKFTQYASKLCNEMLTLAVKDMTATVREVFSAIVRSSEIVPFFDPNHQVKCDRYRRTRPNPVCVFFNLEPSFHSADFSEILGISPFVLSTSEVYKMDDMLPRMLFNIENLVKCVQASRIDLFISLFPSTALLTSIMEPIMNRRERIDLLLYAWCFMFLYYVSMLKYKPKACDSQTLKKTDNRPLALWHTEHVKRYLSSVCAVILTLLDPRPINLGALGSHHNENFFGQVKQMAKYDESIEGFKKAVEKSLLYRKLQQEFNLMISPAGRNSVSGAKISAEEAGELPPIGHYFHFAKSLLELVTRYDNLELSCAIDAFQSVNQLSVWTSPEDALTLLPVSLVSKLSERPSKGVTLRSRRQVSTSGMRCKERYISAGQVKAGVSGSSQVQREDS